MGRVETKGRPISGKASLRFVGFARDWRACQRKSAKARQLPDESSARRDYRTFCHDYRTFCP